MSYDYRIRQIEKLVGACLLALERLWAFMRQ